MMKTDYNEDKTMYRKNDRNNAWAWICPVCGELNLWEWDLDDVPRANDDLDLVCEHCGKSTPMICEMRPLQKPISPPVRSKDILGDAEKLQKEMAAIQGSLPMIEEDIENLENSVRQADRRIAALEKVVARITIETIQSNGDGAAGASKMDRVHSFECRECDIGTDYACTFVDSEGKITPRVCPDDGKPCKWHEVGMQEVNNDEE